MKAKIDPDLCVGTGSCESLCPAVFELGKDGIAVVKLTPVPSEEEDSCRDAAKNCPTEAISIEE